MESSPFNLCTLPPWAIASRHFNRNPQPLEIQGVRRANRLLF
ncbi:MAG: NAD(+)--dinitrogen-reductase ADP-D-ribosyltransferase, partial [Desulfuromonadales bacterium]